MANDTRSTDGRGGKVHPLFVELYLNGDDSAEADEERRTERKRARARRTASAKQVIRRT